MVKCSECAFLTFRHFSTRELVEADEGLRERGEVPYDYSVPPNPMRVGKIPLWKEEPLCFKMACDLTREFQGNNAPELSRRILAVVQKERDCSEFALWKRGFGPRETQAMIDSKLLLEREDKRDREAREFQEREAKVNRRYRIVELLLVIATIIAVLAAAHIERSGQPMINNIIQLPASTPTVPSP